MVLLDLSGLAANSALLKEKDFKSGQAGVDGGAQSAYTAAGDYKSFSTVFYSLTRSISIEPMSSHIRAKSFSESSSATFCR